MYSLHIAAEAAEVISLAFEWYEEQLEGLAERFLDALDERFDAIRTHPMHYGYINEDESTTFRDVMLRRFPYRVVFRVHGEIVVVIAVFHASLDPEKLKARLK